MDLKRFKIQYTINGEQMDLYAEPMDMNHRMFSLERQLMDPHPLLIEKQDNGNWTIKSQDNWSLNPADVTKLGETLEKEFPDQPQQ